MYKITRQTTMKNHDIIILDKRPEWMGKRNKVYTIDPCIFNELSPGKSYDLLCASSSWKYGVPQIIRINNERKLYIVYFCSRIGLYKDIADFINVYACD